MPLLKALVGLCFAVTAHGQQILTLENLVETADFATEKKQAPLLHEALSKLYTLKELNFKENDLEVQKILSTKKFSWKDTQYYLRNEISGRELKPKEVVLTFDDGPHEKLSLAVADYLISQNVPAAFFQVGENVAQHPNVTRSLFEKGFLIANHSWNHSNFTKLDDNDVKFQIDTTQKTIIETLGSGALFAERLKILFFEPLKFLPREIEYPEFMRTPYGARSRRIIDLLKSYVVGKECNEECKAVYLKHVVWLIDSLDWADKIPQSIEKRVFSQLDMYDNRGIILFHDIHEQTYKAIQLIIPRLIKEGYTIKTMYEAYAAHEETYPSVFLSRK